MLSEYARGRAGALMTVGFACWSLSLAASAVWTSGQAARQHGGRALSALLLVSATGMAITAAFRTQTSAGTLHYGAHMATGGRLHDWGSGATSLGLLAAAALTTRLQWMEPTLRRATATLLTATLTIDVLLLAAGDQVQGIRQRLLVTAGCGWQIAFLLSPRKSRRQSED